MTGIQQAGVIVFAVGVLICACWLAFVAGRVRGEQDAAAKVKQAAQAMHQRLAERLTHYTPHEWGD